MPAADPTPEWDALLQEAVQPDGFVDYEVLRANPGPLRDFVGWMALDPGPQSEHAALARGINAYNAFVMLGVLRNWPIESVRDVGGGPIPTFGAGFFRGLTFEFAGKKQSLMPFEDDHLRAGFKDVRIHAAINCASVGCPPLKDGLYTEANLHVELEAAMTRMVKERVRREEGQVVFNQIFDWFEADFTDWTGSATLCDYVARYDHIYAEDADVGCPHRFEEYDWALNQARR